MAIFGKKGHEVKTETDDFDFDWDDLELPMDDFGVDGFGDKDSVSRSPIKRVMSGFKSELLNTDVEKTVKDVLPKGYGQLFDLKDELEKSISEVKTEAVKEFQSNKGTYKRLANQVLDVGLATEGIPKGMRDKLEKYKNKLKDDFGDFAFKEKTKEQRDEAEINASLADIFKVNTLQAAVKEKKDEVRAEYREQIEYKRHQDNQSQLNDIRLSVGRLANYQDKININFQRKSLEMQLRSYKAQLAQLDELKRFSTDVKNELQGIRKNTALADFQKLSLTDAARSHWRNRLIGNVSDKLFSDQGVAGRLIGNVKSQMIDVIRNSSGVAGMTGETLAMMLENVGDGDPLVFAGQMAGKAARHYAIKGARSYITKKTGLERHANRFEMSMMNIEPILRKWARENQGDLDSYQTEDGKWDLNGISESLLNDSGINQSLGSIAPNERRGVIMKSLRALGSGFITRILKPFTARLISNTTSLDTTIKRDSLGDLRQPAIINKHFTKSVTEIIPGYLARILREVTVLRTGDDKTPLTVYDPIKGKFSTANQMAGSIRELMVSNKDIDSKNRIMDKFFSAIEKNGKTLSKEEKEILSKKISSDVTSNDVIINTDYLRSLSETSGLSEESKRKLRLLMKDTLDGSENTKEELSLDMVKNIHSLKEVLKNPAIAMQDLSDYGYSDIMRNMGILNDEHGTNTAEVLRWFTSGGLHNYKEDGYAPSRAFGGNTINVNRNINQRARGISDIRFNTGGPISSYGSFGSPNGYSFNQPSTPINVGSSNRPEIDTTNTESTYEALKRYFDNEFMDNSNYLTKMGELNKALVDAQTIMFEGLQTSLASIGSDSAVNGTTPKQRRSLLGRATGAAIGGVKWFGNWYKNYTKTMLGYIGKGVGAGYNLTRRMLGLSVGDNLVDIYVDDEVALTKRGLKLGHYADQKTGKVIKRLKDITGTVVDREGNVVLASGDIDKAYVKDDGKGRVGLLSTLIGYGSKALSTGTAMLGGYYSNLFKMGIGAFNIAKKTAGKALDYLGAEDIYIPGNPEPVITAQALRQGLYYSKKTGKQIFRTKDIDGTIVDSEGNIVVSGADLAKGMFNKHGQKVSGGIKRILNMGMRNAKRLLNLSMSMSRRGLGIQKSALTGGFSLMKGGWNKLFGNGNIDPENAALSGVIISQESNSILKAIYSLLDERMPGKKIKGDWDGDGVANGSVADLLRKRKGEKEEKESKETDGKTSKKDDEGGLLSKLASLKDKAGGLAALLGLGGEGGILSSAKDWLLGALGLKAGSDGLKGVLGKVFGRGGASAAEGVAAGAGKAGWLSRLFKGGGGKLALLAALGTLLWPRSAKADTTDMIHQYESMGDAKALQERGMSAEEAEAMASHNQAQIAALKESQSRWGMADYAKTGAAGYLGLRGLQALGKGSALNGAKTAFNSVRSVLPTSVASRLPTLAMSAPGASKGLLQGARRLPGVGTALSIGLGAYDAYNGVKQNDYQGVTRAVYNTGGAMGGAAIGASIGSVIPVFGTAIGGMIGGIAGYFLGDKVGSMTYSVGRFFTRRGLGDMDKVRMAQYGFKPNNSICKTIVDLEDMLSKFVIVQGNQVGLKSGFNQERILDMFDVDQGDPESMQAFGNWFNYRFKPVYLNAMLFLQQKKKTDDISELNKLTNEEVTEYFANAKSTAEAYPQVVNPKDTTEATEVNGSDVITAIDDYVAKAKTDAPKGMLSKALNGLGKVMPGFGLAKSASEAVSSMISKNNTDEAKKNASAAKAVEAKESNGFMSALTKAGSIAGAGLGSIFKYVVPTAAASTLITKGDGNVDELTGIRLRAYGLRDLDRSKAESLIKLEALVKQDIRLEGNNQAMYKGDIGLLAKNSLSYFGLNATSANMSRLVTYLKERFIPIYTTYFSEYVRQTNDRSGNNIKGAIHPAKMVVIAEAIRDTKNADGNSIWEVKTSPWEGYALNSDVKSIEGNYQSLKSKEKAAPMSEKVRADALTAKAQQTREEKSLLDTLKEKVSNTWDRVKDTASGVWEGVKGAAGNAWDAITGKQSLGDAWEGVKNAGSAAMESITQGITGNISKGKEEYRRALWAAMSKHGITSKNEVAAFLSQIGVESGNLKWTEELASGAAYEGRRDLGNTQPGDGVRFKGRGLIQLTGRANYTAFAKAMNRPDILQNPSIVSKDPMLAVESAIYYWNSRKGLRQAAQAGDIDRVSRLVNGGTNGINERRAYFRSYLNGKGPLWLEGGLNGQSPSGNSQAGNVAGTTAGSTLGNMLGGQIGNLANGAGKGSTMPSGGMSNDNQVRAQQSYALARQAVMNDSKLTNAQKTARINEINKAAMSYSQQNSNAGGRSSGGVVAGPENKVQYNYDSGKGSTASSSGGGSGQVGKACQWLKQNGKNAHSLLGKPKGGNCAATIGLALHAAGYFSTARGHGHAYQYPQNLKRIGWVQVNDGNYQVGDIAVCMPNPRAKSSGGRQYGHVSMFDGQKWITDIESHSPIPYSDRNTCPYQVIVMRDPKAPANGRVSADEANAIGSGAMSRGAMINARNSSTSGSAEVDRGRFNYGDGGRYNYSVGQAIGGDAYNPSGMYASGNTGMQQQANMSPVMNESVSRASMRGVNRGALINAANNRVSSNDTMSDVGILNQTVNQPTPSTGIFGGIGNAIDRFLGFNQPNRGDISMSAQAQNQMRNQQVDMTVNVLQESLKVQTKQLDVLNDINSGVKQLVKNGNGKASSEGKGSGDKENLKDFIDTGIVEGKQLTNSDVRKLNEMRKKKELNGKDSAMLKMPLNMGKSSIKA